MHGPPGSNAIVGLLYGVVRWSDSVSKSTEGLTSGCRHVSHSSQPWGTIVDLCAFDRIVTSSLLPAFNIQCLCVTAPRGRVQCTITLLKAVERLLRHKSLLLSCCTRWLHGSPQTCNVCHTNKILLATWLCSENGKHEFVPVVRSTRRLLVCRLISGPESDRHRGNCSCDCFACTLDRSRKRIPRWAALSHSTSAGSRTVTANEVSLGISHQY
jgi:hypothetical protein